MYDSTSASLQAAEELPVTASLGPMGPVLRQLRSPTSRLEGLSDGEIQNFREVLEGLCVSLVDLSEAQDLSFTAKCWMREVRELCYDVKDYFDDVLRPLAEFKKLEARARYAAERRDRYKIDPRNFKKVKFPPMGRRLPALHEDLFDHGPMDELENLLGNDKEMQVQPKLLSIVGLEGVGKTMVAKRLYRKLGGKFQCRAFLRVSPNPDLRRLFTSLFIQIQRQQPSCHWDVQELCDHIAKHLRDKRYLIIVDDLWTTTVWNIISRAFPGGGSCSRVITTTQIKDVALACCGYQSKCVFEMRCLNDDQSRKLFFSTVFGSEDDCPSELKEVSYSIIKKCGGLPLSTINISSLLPRQPNLHHWKHIRDSLPSIKRTFPTSEGMKEIVNLVYNNLPSHLKTCLLYLNMYPEDYTIRKDDLVKQWIVEGFVSVVEGQEKDVTARGYFDELVNRGMIQPVDTNDEYEVLSCRVHHMVADLIAFKSVEENFMTTMDHFQSPGGLVDKVRRLSVQFGGARSANVPASITVCQVHSLAFFGFFECTPSIVEYKILRVLILHIWADQDKASFDLTRVDEMSQLRYLRIKCNITVNLPDKIQGLRWLETLDLDARVAVIPSDIGHLENLLHLHLPREANLPHGFQHIASLRTLRNFDLSSNTTVNVKDLIKMASLRDLHLTCSALQPSDLLEKNIECLGFVLGKLSSLKSVTLVPVSSCLINTLDDASASRRNIFFDGFSCVSPAPLLLERLELLPQICFFRKLPNWFQVLDKLCILKVAVDELSSEDIQLLKALPALTALSLHVHTSPVERIILDKSGFLVLKYFKFRCSIPSLKFEADAMPNLRKLKLGFNAPGSDQHGTMPVGIEYLTGLKEISAKIWGIGADGSDRMSAESAFSDVTRGHLGHTINIKFVDRMLGGKNGKNSQIQVEEHRTLQQQYEIMEESSNVQHVVQKKSRDDASKQAYSSKLDSSQGQIQGVHQEVKQLARLSSNRQTDQHTTLEPNHEHGTSNRSNTSIRLCFLNDLKTPIYTKNNVGAENNEAIKIAIFEGNTMIRTGPLSKLKVEIMVLRGDFYDDGRESWTGEEFKNHIVQGRDGQGFVLEGDFNVRLNNGEASLGQLRFKEGSSRTRSRKFSIGARVCKSENTDVRIQEAVMKPVTVLDRQNKAYQKSHPPKVDDAVYRLKEISKDGTYHGRLKKACIFTVQDFLKALNKNDKKLREEVLEMKTQHKSWEKMVKHARECYLGDMHDLKAYPNGDGSVTLYFNCVHQLIGAAFHGVYVAQGRFDPAHKALVNKLKECVHEKLENFSFDYVMKNNFPEKISLSSNADKLAHKSAADPEATLFANEISKQDGKAHEMAVMEMSEKHPSSKRKRTEEKRLSRRVKELEDGFNWRKYGQKDVLGAKHPRSYFRCASDKGCPARKHVQPTDDDPLLYDVIYAHNHTCDRSAHSLFQEESSQGLKQRKDTLPKVKKHVSCAVSSGQIGDGFSWRKYGQKVVLGAKHPRSATLVSNSPLRGHWPELVLNRREYYRCAFRHTQDCLATKKMQRRDGDPSLYDIVYYGNHTCDRSTHSPLQPGQEQSSLSIGVTASHVDMPPADEAVSSSMSEIPLDWGFPMDADEPMMDDSGFPLQFGQEQSTVSMGVKDSEFRTEDLFDSDFSDDLD